MIELTGVVRNISLNGFSTDAFRVVDDNTTLVNVNAQDTYVLFKDLLSFLPKIGAHRDYIQLIPKRGKEKNSQYALARLRNFTAKFGSVYSNGRLQGIFCSDGLLENITLQNNVIQTQSEHKITLNGCLSGVIQGNTNAKGRPVSTVLNPARVGGNMDGSENIWISSFKNTYEYGTVVGDHIIDNRSKKLRKGDIYLDNFDYELFARTITHQSLNVSTREYTRHLKDIALLCGDRHE